jgi:diadenosine hexaphosphate hydrolase (ATP-forming)
VSAPSQAPSQADAQAERPVLGAGGLVFDARGEVLVLRHRDGSWVFPKGHIDPGETALEAALREVAEEAGVTAHCPDPTALLTTRYLNRRRERREILWFLCLTGDAAPTCPEALFPEGGFFEAAEAARRLTFSEDRLLLQQALRLLRRVP